MGPVALELLGEPSERKGKTLLYGTRGSFSVCLEKGVWRDFEADEGGGVLDLVMRERSTDKDSALAWLEERKFIPARPAGRTSPRIVATYDYADGDGVLLFQVVRFEPKTFRQRRPDGAGGWIWKMAGVELVLYRLPDLEPAIRAGKVVYVVEGEKSADLLAKAGLTATCSPGGANKWKPHYSPALRGADVVILPDNDEAGRAHAVGVAAALKGMAARVRVLALPDLPDKGDVADWLAEGGTREALEAMVRDAEPDSEGESASTTTEAKKARPKREPRPATNKPIITVQAGEFHAIADAGEEVLLSAGEPIYQRGSMLVRPASREVPASDGRTTIGAAMAELTIPALMDVWSRVAEWEKFDARADGMVRANPPRAVAEIYLSRFGFWRVPSLAGLVTTPTMRPDGSILNAGGYDPATRLFHVLDPALQLHPAVKKPSRADAEAALKLLSDLLGGFPFVGDVSKAVALSALITPVVRGAVPVAPMHVFRAPTPGSGKSYLADVASVIATGRLCPVASAAPDEAETEKRLVGLLLAGFPIISLDNVNGELGGDFLCQAIERQLIAVRPLGRSNITEIESRATIFGNGNQLRVRGDMVRRTLVADLDAEMERPEERQFAFDPVAVVMTDRSRYVSACLIIVRAYCLAERPGARPHIQSFGAWSDLVRSALLWLGTADPVESMKQAREDDPELGDMREVMGAWHQAFGSVGINVRRVIEAAITPVAKADENGDVPAYGASTALPFPALNDVLLRLFGARGVIDNRRMGKWMLDHEKRPVGGMRFVREGTTDGAARWKLEVMRHGDRSP